MRGSSAGPRHVYSRLPQVWWQTFKGAHFQVVYLCKLKDSVSILVCLLEMHFRYIHLTDHQTASCLKSWRVGQLIDIKDSLINQSIEPSLHDPQFLTLCTPWHLHIFPPVSQLLCNSNLHHSLPIIKSREMVPVTWSSRLPEYRIDYLALLIQWQYRHSRTCFAAVWYARIYHHLPTEGDRNASGSLRTLLSVKGKECQRQGVPTAPIKVRFYTGQPMLTFELWSTPPQAPPQYFVKAAAIIIVDSV